MVLITVKYQKLAPFSVEVDATATQNQLKEQIALAVARAQGGEGASLDSATDLDRLRLIFSGGSRKKAPGAAVKQDKGSVASTAGGTVAAQGISDGATVLLLGQVLVRLPDARGTQSPRGGNGSSGGTHSSSPLGTSSTVVKRQGADLFTALAINVEGATLRCTYGRGYALQPVFVCLTCSRRQQRRIQERDASSKADVVVVEEGETLQDALLCKACALHCHAGHDVEQHGFWWHSRCDCPTAKFGGHHTCSLVVDAASKKPFECGLPPNLHNLKPTTPMPSTGHGGTVVKPRPTSSLCYCQMDDGLDLTPGERRFLIEAESACLISEDGATTGTTTTTSSGTEGSNQDSEGEDDDSDSDDDASDDEEDDDADPALKKRIQAGKGFRVCQLCHLAVCRSHLTTLDLTLKVKFMVCSNSWSGGRYRYDRITVRCRTCSNKSVCACCALHCHRGHDLGVPSLSEYATCSCKPCIRHQVQPEEAVLDELRMEEIGSTMQRLLCHYPTDLRLDPFICGYCMQKHRPWLLEGGSQGLGTCHQGSIPVLPDSAIQPVRCKMSSQFKDNNLSSSEKSESTAGGGAGGVQPFPCQGMVVTEDLLAEYTCKCEPCVQAYDALFPGYLCMGEDLRSMAKAASTSALLCCTRCSAAQFRLDEVEMHYCERCTAANPTEVPLVLCGPCSQTSAGAHEHPLTAASGDPLRFLVLRHMASVGLLGEELQKLVAPGTDREGSPPVPLATTGAGSSPQPRVEAAFKVLLLHLKSMEGKAADEEDVGGSAKVGPDVPRSSGSVEDAVQEDASSVVQQHERPDPDSPRDTKRRRTE